MDNAITECRSSSVSRNVARRKRVPDDAIGATRRPRDSPQIRFSSLALPVDRFFADVAILSKSPGCSSCCSSVSSFKFTFYASASSRDGTQARTRTLIIDRKHAPRIHWSTARITKRSVTRRRVRAVRFSRSRAIRHRAGAPNGRAALSGIAIALGRYRRIA